MFWQAGGIRKNAGTGNGVGTGVRGGNKETSRTSAAAGTGRGGRGTNRTITTTRQAKVVRPQARSGRRGGA